jgi:hypothetical protein
LQNAVGFCLFVVQVLAHGLLVKVGVLTLLQQDLAASFQLGHAQVKFALNGLAHQIGLQTNALGFGLDALGFQKVACPQCKTAFSPSAPLATLQ